MNQLVKKSNLLNKTGRLSKEEIDRILSDAEKYKAADAGIAKKITAKNDLENYTYQMRNTLDDPKFKEQIKENDRTKIEKAVKDVTDWLDGNPNAELEEFEQKKKDLEEIWKPIIMNIYGQSGEGGDSSGMPNMGNFGGANMGNFGGGDSSETTSGPQIDDLD
jgi:L1 cell adhesion molecule like protein